MAVQSVIFSALQTTFLKRFGQAQRVTLSADETIHISLRPTGQRIRALSGCAWVTCNGRDILLEPGQEIRLPRRGDVALISTIGQVTTIIEFSREVLNGSRIMQKLGKLRTSHG